jgi:hypothetical protein
MGVSMTYEETKRRKLKRMISLRIMNALGMVSWLGDGYGEAKQHLRLIHPLTWAWIVAMGIFGVLAQGIPDTLTDIKHSLKEDTVWF